MKTSVFDKSSPLLLAALTSGERLTEIEPVVPHLGCRHARALLPTNLLEDAIIADIKDYMHNCQDPSTSHFTHLEDVEFTYRKPPHPRSVGHFRFR